MEQESFEGSTWLEVQDDAFKSLHGFLLFLFSLLSFLFFWLLKKSDYLSYRVSHCAYFANCCVSVSFDILLSFYISCKLVVECGGLIRFLLGEGLLCGFYWEAHGVWLSLVLGVAINDQCLNPLIHWELQNGEILILSLIFLLAGILLWSNYLVIGIVCIGKVELIIFNLSPLLTSF